VDALFTTEQRLMRETIQAFCRDDAVRRAALHLPFDAPERLHDPALYRQLADLGWLGVSIPPEFGGGGGTLIDLCIVLEETARGHLPLEGFQVSLVVGEVVARYGNDRQRARVLGDFAAGGVASIAMSEPGAGSDLTGIACRATVSDDGFLVNGQKTWTSAAHLARNILLVVRTGVGESAGRGHSGLSMLLVPGDLAGMTIVPIQTMGGHEVNEIYFEDCRLPPDSLVGELDRGWRHLVGGLNYERLIVAAQALGMAEGSLDQTLGYVSTREQFGRPVGSFQALSHRIADLAADITACRALLYVVATSMVSRPDIELPGEAAMVKLKATELCKRAALEGMQMMGGMGYACESGMEQQVRRALKMTIGGGTSEIQRDIIARSLGLRTG
jgi:alkylation response protein AidB-like acyl-CoA dehydrogenase